MKDLIKDQLPLWTTKGELDIEGLAGYLYGEECNFNNADPTSGQRCYEEWEIIDLITEVVNKKEQNDK